MLPFLLPDLDSNQDKQNQNLSYYHYTIGQYLPLRECKNKYFETSSKTFLSFSFNKMSAKNIRVNPVRGFNDLSDFESESSTDGFRRQTVEL